MLHHSNSLSGGTRFKGSVTNTIPILSLYSSCPAFLLGANHFCLQEHPILSFLRKKKKKIIRCTFSWMNFSRKKRKNTLDMHVTSQDRATWKQIQILEWRRQYHLLSACNTAVQTIGRESTERNSTARAHNLRTWRVQAGRSSSTLFQWAPTQMGSMRPCLRNREST